MEVAASLRACYRDPSPYQDILLLVTLPLLLKITLPMYYLIEFYNYLPLYGTSREKNYRNSPSLVCQNRHAFYDFFLFVCWSHCEPAEEYSKVQYKIGWENHFCSLLLALSPRKHRTITQRISSFLWPGFLQKRKSCLAREKIIFLEKRKWKSHVHSSQPNIWLYQRGRSDRSLQCVVLLDFRWLQYRLRCWWFLYECLCFPYILDITVWSELYA